MSTKKRLDFVSEPMQNRPITDVPGIGNATGECLREAGYEQATQLFGQYLVMDRNARKFTKWMQKTSSASVSDASRCYDSLDEWYDNFM